MISADRFAMARMPSQIGNLALPRVTGYQTQKRYVILFGTTVLLLLTVAV
jgi:hypothetical protein